MCVVSMVGDYYGDKWKSDPYKDLFKQIHIGISQADFEALRKEVQEMKELLKRAIKYDEANNEPNCEMEEKVKLLKEVAKAVGVDLEEIFKPK